MQDYDYIIVGSGAAGAASAWRLATQGYRVICLERGPHMSPEHYPSTSADWEIKKNTTFHPAMAVRQNQYDYPVDDQNSPIAVCNFNAVGGSTILYSGHFPRFLKRDFMIHSETGLGADWPIQYDALLPYFALNEYEMGLSGLAGDPFYPEIETAMPPVPLGQVGHRLGKAFNEKGWHWWPSFAAIATRSRQGRDACINLGPCNTGCPQGAKGSVDITYIKRALKAGLTLETEFAVTEVLVENHKAIGVLGYNQQGEKVQILGKHVILAASAVGTPRILLHSKSKAYPNGLGNHSDQVGKHLMIHPLGYVEGLFDEPLQTASGPQGCLLYSLEFHRCKEAEHQLGYMMHALRGTGPVEVAKAALSRRKLRFGAALYDDFHAWYEHQAVISIICEDPPEAHNHLSLDEAHLDRFGMPGIKVQYKLHTNTQKMMTHGMQQARSLMQAAGAKKSYAYGPVRQTGWHLMGTCKMGADPANSVVNTKGQVHDVEGLYVIDGSVFPSSSCVNPANTIQAVALYLTDQIIGQQDAA